jgi:CheY-like chemotaxis protein
MLDLSGLTLLVVDDNDDALDMLTTYLRSCGAHVLQTRSAIGALAYVDTNQSIDAVATDLSMPHMDAAFFRKPPNLDELCRTIRDVVSR